MTVAGSLLDTVQSAPDACMAQGRAFARLEPAVAFTAQMHGALLVDIRPRAVRRLDGEIPGALVVAGPVREWRVEPGDPLRVVELGSTLPVIVVGDGGAASILAASALRRYRVDATDVIGGFPAWQRLGLPVTAGATLAGHYVD